MNISEFAKRILGTLNSSPVVVSAFVANAGATWIKIRALLADDSFIDVFFNEVTEKTAYTWIKDDRRIFGADNTQDWHWHPFDNPESHLPAKSTVSFDAFLHKVEEYFRFDVG